MLDSNSLYVYDEDGNEKKMPSYSLLTVMKRAANMWFSKTQTMMRAKYSHLAMTTKGS